MRYGYRYSPTSRVFEIPGEVSEADAMKLVEDKRKMQQVRGNSPDAATVELVRMAPTGAWVPVGPPPTEPAPVKGHGPEVWRKPTGRQR